ncbi:MAG: hypothetical protein WCP28_20655 [Actinomycetes bacterium]
MSTQKTGYLVALVVAVVVLLGSVGMAVAHGISSHRTVAAGKAGSGTNDNNRGMMGQDNGRGQGMMGRGGGYGGMMDQGDDDAAATVSADQARVLADAWLAKNQPGATAGAVVTMPMGYVFPVTRNGTGVGTVMVNDDNGSVVFHAWGGASAAPTPTPTSTG